MTYTNEKNTPKKVITIDVFRTFPPVILFTTGRRTKEARRKIIILMTKVWCLSEKHKTLVTLVAITSGKPNETTPINTIKLVSSALWAKIKSGSATRTSYKGANARTARTKV